MHAHRRFVAFLFIASSLGCSSDEGAAYPYPSNRTLVIGSSDDGLGERDPDAPELPGIVPVRRTTTSSTELCLEDGEDCDTPESKCGDGAAAEVIVGAGGDVLSIVCYPNRDRAVRALGDKVEEPDLDDDVVAVIDGSDDGVDVEGDLLVEDNDVIVWGDGPEASVIGGNLEVIESRTVVRGVRIQGDAILRKNDIALVHCVIEGDLLVIGDNVSLALCEIWGDLIIDGAGTVLVSNLIAGDQQLRGMSLRCHDNHRFTDVEGDGVVQDEDVLAPVNCLPSQ